MEKIKILYIVSTLRRGGPTTQLLGIISNLDKNIYEPHILTLSPEPLNSKIQDFFENNIKIDSLNLSRIAFNIYGKNKVEKFIRDFNPNVIHTSGVRADTCVSSIKNKPPHCMTIRNYAYDDYIAKFGKITGGIAANKSIKAMNKSKYVVCCSKTLQSMYEKILEKKPLVIQNGVNTKIYNPVENYTIKNEIKIKLGFPEEKILLLVSGSLISRKDPLTIIKAFNKSKVKQNALLIFLGSGNLEEKCKENSDENIIFRGEVVNVIDYLKASDIYISASKSEGLPNSVLEAGGCGLDMILSDIPQHREIFEGNESIVSWFNVADEEELEKLINSSIYARKDKSTNRMSKFISENFSNEVTSHKYSDLYRNMISGGKK